ncbi:MAG: beta-ketoacyl-ACP synthase III [Syntrophobacterales bacterium]|jgi:3-oxoacyl-[acyl-carrier-protein] synthase-3|nr:beta-ketoacyl-ACP synthase III [Syntrophobacterales bacterium]
MDVYITDIAAFLPNNPVSNDEIDSVLGVLNNMPSKIKQIILASNNIQKRYYAIDRATGATTHTNAQLTAEAVRRLMPYDGFSLRDIECLCCGTSTPDQLMPGHGLMVHGELKSQPCEVVTTSGICLSGVTALKYAYMNVALGLTKNAVATGSDVASTYTRARFFEGVAQKKQAFMRRDKLIPFDTAFLRWMLSDGAGAIFLATHRAVDKPALRIDWIEHISYAGELETCMYSGAKKSVDGTMTGWRDFSTLHDALAEGAFLIKQDVKLLNREALKVAVERTLPRVMEKHNLVASEVDWFLPHYSSEYFKMKFYEHMKNMNFEIPLERWFSNLSYKGNTGAASIYIIMEELFHSHKIKKGQKILCFIPESGRFSMCYMALTAV